MSRRIIALITCGLAGTRLWPALREVRPRQFLPLFGARSTFVQFERFKGVDPEQVIRILGAAKQNLEKHSAEFLRLLRVHTGFGVAEF